MTVRPSPPPTTPPPSRRNRRNPANEDQYGLFDLGLADVLVPAVPPSTREPEATFTTPVAYDPLPTPPRNYVIGKDDRLGSGSLARKAQENLRAIRLVRQLEAEGRRPTPEEQSILVRYTGWGALSQVFQKDHPEWGDVGRELAGLLTPKELRKAEGSTPTAYYTPGTVIRAIYRLLERLGFHGGRILEPSAGIGHFIGLAPRELHLSSQWTAVELDTVTAHILHLLYPDADVRMEGFETADLPDASFDAVVGNVPFGSYTIFDPKHNPDHYRIHDYFLVRSLAALRSGGLLCVITSSGTLDKARSEVRDQIARSADFLGAIRLPNTTFRATAGTQATTDLIVFRKRHPQETPNGHPWTSTVPYETPDGSTTLNEFYAAHPEMMLGEMRLLSSAYRAQEPSLLPLPGQNLEASLEEALAFFPTNVYTEATPTPRNPDRETSCPEIDPSIVRTTKEGSFVIHDDLLYQKRSGRLEAVRMTQRDERRVRLLAPLRDAVRQVLHTQMEDQSEERQEEARAELNRHYDHFHAQFGCINHERRFETTRGHRSSVSIRRPNLQPFRSDPDWPLVAALEVYDPESDTATKAAIFFQRVVRPTRDVAHVDNPLDGLLLCLDRTGSVDLKFISNLWSGHSEEDVADALSGRIYQNPATQAWETSEEYLSGRVRKKLQEAREAAESDIRYEANVRALEAVQPRDLEPSEIDAALGAAWVPADDVRQFIYDLLGEVSKNATIEIAHLPREAQWSVRGPRWLTDSVEATRTWGTDRAHALRLIEDLLNQKSTEIFDRIKDANGSERTVRNSQASIDAQEKQTEITTRFEEWIWEEPHRAQRLLRHYNDTFGGIQLRQYDGSHLSFPGASIAVQMDPHQKNGIWQILSTGNALIAHCVGAGKTFLAIAAGMKLRQVGLARKVMHVTMNHMLEQYSREFLQLYPTARLLIAGTDDLSGDGRRLFMARVAAGDYDAIVTTHGAFGKLPMSAEFEQQYLESEMDAYQEMLEDAKDQDDRLSIKQINSNIKALEARIKSLMGRQKKDGILTFEELGVDALFVDEIHLFKNLDTQTKIRGIPKASRPSARATDLLMKSIYLDSLRPGRGLVGMSGTPISNTLAELHVMARYIAPRLLEERGITHFDAFAGTFVKRVNTLELSPDGATFRLRTRFHFTNVAELVLMFRTFTDVQMIQSYYEAPDGSESSSGTLRLPIPQLRGGKPEILKAPASEELRTYTQQLVRRAERIRNGEVEPWEDNMLLVAGDGRKAALDIRLVIPSAPDWEESKINRAVREIFKTWEATASERLTQLVFCDLSRPRYDGRFSIYNDVVEKLISLGIPPEEIAFAQDATTDARKANLFRAVREGRIRILMGSTSTMGTGTNVQDRVIRTHHLDAPWRPSDIEQRDGRMMRRGNRNEVCEITRYVTEESFDAYVWNLLHYKLTMINRVMLADLSIRRVSEEDGAELSFAQIKAIASGNPMVLEKAGVDQQVLRLLRARRAFQDRQIRNRIDLTEIPERIRIAERLCSRIQADLDARQDTRGDLFQIQLAEPGDWNATRGLTSYTDRTEAAPRLRQILIESSHVARHRSVIRIGHFAGFELHASVWEQDDPQIILIGKHEWTLRFQLAGSSPRGNLQALEYLPRQFESALEAQQGAMRHYQQQLTALKADSNPNFPGESELEQALKRQAELERLLSDPHARGQDLLALETAPAADEEDDAP